MSQPLLPVRARLFAWSVGAAGAAVLAVSFVELQDTGVDVLWSLLTVLAASSGLAVLRVHRLPANFSVGETFSFAVLFLFGPAAAVVTSAVDSLCCNLRLGQMRVVQHVFNVAAPVLAYWIAGVLLFETLGLPMPGAHPPAVLTLAAVCGAAALVFVLESGLVAVVIGLQDGRSPARAWRTLRSLWLNSVVGAYVGFLIAYFHDALDASVLLLVVPIPLMLYYGFRTWLGRLNDQVDHLDQTNRAYRAMVESFATAVDARDEVTHGHILRVQTYARALAAHAGVTDPPTLEALDVAALLHDIGKLGIPDQILNKPGPLTPAEFEIMKTHVEIGTRILGGIEFPYPILPIVRHHHENWDGTGYPDHLAGESIAIGARILMIVDCFDALTSDRPYRRRMSVPDAVAILEARRGTMYDERLVTIFLDLLPTLGVATAPASAFATPVFAASAAVASKLQEG